MLVLLGLYVCPYEMDLLRCFYCHHTSAQRTYDVMERLAHYFYYRYASSRRLLFSVSEVTLSELSSLQFILWAIV